MNCAACAATVQEALADTSGVRDAAVNFATGKAAIDYDEGSTDLPGLIEAIRAAGYDSGSSHVSFQVQDLHYAAGVEPLERELQHVPGVIRVSANQATETVMVEHVPGAVAGDELARAVRRAGFGLAAPIAGEDPLERERVRRRRETVTLAAKFALAAFVAVIAMLGTMMLMAETAGHDTFRRYDLLGQLLLPAAITLRSRLELGALNPLAVKWALAAVTLPVLVWSGRQFFRGAWSGLRHRSADMNTLIALGTGAAFLYSLLATAFAGALERAGVPADVYYEAVAGIIALVLLGRLLEARAKGRSSEAIQRLGALAPRTARVIREGAEVELPVDAVAPGDDVVVRPGERIPADGVVIEGASAVSEAAITGEPMPVAKKTGDQVIGGTINTTGSITFRATRVGGEATLGQIVRLVEEAQARKAPIQRLVDRVAGIFVPIVLALAIAAFIVWFDFGPPPAALFATAALITVLIISCPCAMGLATPTAILVGTGKAAEHGILIRGGDVLEPLARARTVLLDKTGTVTEGAPAVTQVLTSRRSDGSQIGAAELLRYAASVESRSEHPIAMAILRAARELQVEPPPVEQFVAMEGRGARGLVDRRLVEVISLRHARERSLALGALTADAERLEGEGRSPVVVAINNTVHGVIAIADPVKPHARQAVAGLRALGLRVILISGDSRASAEAVGREIGIEEIISEVLPSQKAELVKKLQRERRGGAIAMVGDGINDAPALAQADIGIAIGTGTDVAIEASGVTLMRGDLRAVVTAVELSRRTLRTIRGNLIWAFGYNILGIPIAAGALYPFTGLLLSPVVASAAMAWSSLSVVLNSLSLKRYTPSWRTS